VKIVPHARFLQSRVIVRLVGSPSLRTRTMSVARMRRPGFGTKVEARSQRALGN